MSTLAYPIREGSEPPPLNIDVEDNPLSLATTIRAGDHVFERTVVDTRNRFPIPEVKAIYRRRIIEDVTLEKEGLTITFTKRLPADESIVTCLHSRDPTWRTYPPPGMPDFPRSRATSRDVSDWKTALWEPRRVAPPPLDRVADLEFQHVEGQGSRRLINHLLIGGPDGRIDHRLGGVAKWKAGFIATHDSHPYSVAVLAQPYTYNYDGARNEWYITRLANHPNRPPNTSSWMLARLRDWAREHTNRERLVAIAGVDGNEGTCYRAAGFDLDAKKTVSSTRWEVSRVGRTPARRDTWTARRYVCEI